MTCDVFDGNLVNGIREPILFSFVLDKLAGYKIFCELETLHSKLLNKSALNAIKSYIEDDNHA